MHSLVFKEIIKRGKQYIKYCYANTDAALVKKNMKCHDPKSAFLLGGNQPGDVIHEAVQKSWIDRQMRLEL